MDREEQIAGLEKQLTSIEDELAKLLQDGGEEDKKAVKRYQPGDAVKKAKKKGDPSEYEEMEEEADEEDMDKQAKDDAAVKKAADEKAAVEKAAVEKAAADKAAADKVAKGDDESVTIEGQTITKSAVGPAAFAIFKAQADKLAKAEQAITEERDLRKMAELKKRADDEFPNIPGTVDERATMLKAIGAMDEALQKSFNAVLTSAQKLSKTAFDTLGHNGGDKAAGVIAKDFETKVSEIKKRDECSQQEALTKARKEFPEEFKAYQDSAPRAN